MEINQLLDRLWPLHISANIYSSYEWAKSERNAGMESW
jgi:hypothetical protein